MKKILIISANYYVKISSEMSREAKNALDSSKSSNGKKKVDFFKQNKDILFPLIFNIIYFVISIK